MSLMTTTNNTASKVDVVGCVWLGNGFELTLACGCKKVIGHIGTGSYGSRVMKARGIAPGSEFPAPYDRAFHKCG